MFHKHQSIRIALDWGATGNIRRSAAILLGADIVKTKQSASQADGSSPLKVIGETHSTIGREEHRVKFDGLVVEKLDVDILGGVPSMKYNDIQIRPSKYLITIGGHNNCCYGDRSHDECSKCQTSASILSFNLMHGLARRVSSTQRTTSI